MVQQQRFLNKSFKTKNLYNNYTKTSIYIQYLTHGAKSVNINNDSIYNYLKNKFVNFSVHNILSFFSSNDDDKNMQQIRSKYDKITENKKADNSLNNDNVQSNNFSDSQPFDTNNYEAKTQDKDNLEVNHIQKTIANSNQNEQDAKSVNELKTSKKNMHNTRDKSKIVDQLNSVSDVDNEKTNNKSEISSKMQLVEPKTDIMEIKSITNPKTTNENEYKSENDKNSDLNSKIQMDQSLPIQESEKINLDNQNNAETKNKNKDFPVDTNTGSKKPDKRDIGNQNNAETKNTSQNFPVDKNTGSKEPDKTDIGNQNNAETKNTSQDFPVDKNTGSKEPDKTDIGNQNNEDKIVNPKTNDTSNSLENLSLNVNPIENIKNIPNYPSIIPKNDVDNKQRLKPKTNDNEQNRLIFDDMEIQKEDKDSPIDTQIEVHNKDTNKNEEKSHTTEQTESIPEKLPDKEKINKNLLKQEITPVKDLRKKTKKYNKLKIPKKLDAIKAIKKDISEKSNNMFYLDKDPIKGKSDEQSLFASKLMKVAKNKTSNKLLGEKQYTNNKPNQQFFVDLNAKPIETIDFSEFEGKNRLSEKAQETNPLSSQNLIINKKVDKLNPSISHGEDQPETDQQNDKSKSISENLTKASFTTDDCPYEKVTSSDVEESDDNNSVYKVNKKSLIDCVEKSKNKEEKRCKTKMRNIKKYINKLNETNCVEFKIEADNN